MGEDRNNNATNEPWTGYCVELGEEDMFEGFMIDGHRHGESRCTWNDGDVMLCTWQQGVCREHDRKDKEKENTKLR